MRLIGLSLIKVKKSLYRPEQALRFPGIGDFQISRQSAHEDGVRLPTLRNSHFYPPPPQKKKIIFLTITFFSLSVK